MVFPTFLDYLLCVNTIEVIWSDMAIMFYNLDSWNR